MRFLAVLLAVVAATNVVAVPTAFVLSIWTHAPDSNRFTATGIVLLALCFATVPAAIGAVPLSRKDSLPTVSGEDWLVLDGKMRHVVAVFEGQSRKWYIDGKQVYPAADPS